LVDPPFAGWGLDYPGERRPEPRHPSALADKERETVSDDFLEPRDT
jgi:hypothetical protein